MVKFYFICGFFLRLIYIFFTAAFFRIKYGIIHRLVFFFLNCTNTCYYIIIIRLFVVSIVVYLFKILILKKHDKLVL
jgi:hypothetical protein